MKHPGIVFQLIYQFSLPSLPPSLPPSRPPPRQGSAKLEKAEILQMTVDHLRHLHQSRDPRGKAVFSGQKTPNKKFLVAVKITIREKVRCGYWSIGLAGSL